MKRLLAFLLALLCLTACAAPVQTPETPPAEEEASESNYLASAMLEEQLISDQEWVEELFGYFPAPEPATDVPPEERTQLTLVGVAVQEGFSMIVEGFNRSNPRYYVTLTDYGWNSSDKKQGLTTLQTKLMAGQFPDMLYFSLNVTEGAMRDERFLSPLPLISKGLLLDLDPLLEADPDINKEDIAGWKGLHEYGGLYLLPPGPESAPCRPPKPSSGNGPAGPSTNIWNGKPICPRDSTCTITWTPHYFLEAVGSRYVRDTMDIENATCDFDNPEFISILKSAARAESYQYEAESNHAFKQIIKQLEDQDIIVATGVGEPEWIAFDRKFVSEDARFTYIGWPTPDGSCGSDLQLTFPIGVCADTDQAQGCWEFLKYMLQHPITAGDNAPLALYIPIFPEAMKVYNGQRNNYFPMIQADLDKALDLANQCEHMAFYDEAVLRIILEEAEWFLKGDATAEDTAAKIQARASLYLSEQYG